MLNRFLTAQEGVFPVALEELRRGRKDSHWMWFIFPQLKGLGMSSTSIFYGIQGLTEAKDYISHPILRQRLIDVCQAILPHTDKTARHIFGSIDAMKLCSCMTLFRQAAPEIDVFDKVLQQFFHGKPDDKTLKLLNE